MVKIKYKNRVIKFFLDMGTMKRTLKPMPSLESPVTSPEIARRRSGYSYYHQPPPVSTMTPPIPQCPRQTLSEPESNVKHRNSRFNTLGKIGVN